MADIKLVIRISKEDYERLKEYKKAPFCSLTSRIYEAIANGVPLTPDILADLLMEERIRGELKQDISYSKDIIDDAISRQIISDYVESHIQEINTGYGDLATNYIKKGGIDHAAEKE